MKKQTLPNIEVRLGYDSIRIYINGLLHLKIVRSKFLGMQAWKWGERNYSIEYTMVGGAVLTEYDDFEKFSFILKALDKIL